MSVKKHENAGSGCSGACCLKVADLSVSLGEQTILEHVSFHLHCGEITALIGPNGAGKSTLFRTILGQLPYAGTIDFQQAGGRRTRPLIGYVPQSPSFDRGDPVSVLDLFVSAIEGEKQLLDMLDEVRRFYDLSILLSTHDFATLEEYADKVILLQSGVLKAGTPAEVLSSPEFQEVFHLSLGRGRG